MRFTTPGCVLMVLILLAVTACAGNTAVPEYSPAESALNPDAALADIALARSSLERLHAGYDRYTPMSELDAHWARLVDIAETGIGRGQLYLELSRILAELRCDHTKAELPRDLEEARNSSSVYLPFRSVLFDRHLFIDVARKGTGLNRGDQILAIDGREIDWWLRRIEPLIPVDGYTDHVKRLEFSYSTEFMGSALDHFAPFLAPIDDSVVLKVRNKNGSIRDVELTRQTYVDFQDMVGEKRYSSNFVDSVRFERLGDDAAYLAVDTFVNYRRPVDPVAHLAPYFQDLRKEGRSKLIVDLRRNGGGSNDAQNALLRHLLREPVSQVEAVYTRFNSISEEQRRHLDTWDKRLLSPGEDWFERADNGFYKIVKPELTDGTGELFPAVDAFDGEIIVLTGPSNSSGSTHLIAALTAADRVTLVGERTGGSPTGATAGMIFFLTLPESGIRVRIPAIRTVIANAERLPQDNGLDPDVYAPITPEDYFADRDPALEAAKQMFGL